MTVQPLGYPQTAARRRQNSAAPLEGYSQILWDSLFPEAQHNGQTKAVSRCLEVGHERSTPLLPI